MTVAGLHCRGSESEITTHNACWLLRTVFVTLALTGCGSAAAGDDGNGGVVGRAGTGAPGNSSKQVRPADFRLSLDALDLNVYGLAYHPDRETVHRQHLDNEFNPGLGLHYELDNNARGITFVEVGAYRDSGRNWAKFASLGYQFKLGERWRIGGAVAAMNSRTYNHGVGFVAMIPLITYDMGRIKLNAVYFPKFGDYNEVAAYGLYISIPIGQWARQAVQKR
jgi:hypothetical protein